MLSNLQGFQGKWKSKARGHSVFLFKKLVGFCFVFFAGDWSQVSCQRRPCEMRCLQAFKRSPIMTESLMGRWLSGSVKWTFPFAAPCSLAPRRWLHSLWKMNCMWSLSQVLGFVFCCGQSLILLIEAIFFPFCFTSRLIQALSDFGADTFQRYTSLASESRPSQYQPSAQIEARWTYIPSLTERVLGREQW